MNTTGYCILWWCQNKPMQEVHTLPHSYVFPCRFLRSGRDLIRQNHCSAAAKRQLVTHLVKGINQLSTNALVVSSQHSIAAGKTQHSTAQHSTPHEVAVEPHGLMYGEM